MTTKLHTPPLGLQSKLYIYLESIRPLRRPDLINGWQLHKQEQLLTQLIYMVNELN